MASASFSGLGKELLALRFSETPQVERQFKPIYESIPLPEMKVEPNQVEQQFTKSVGNFI